LRRRHIVAGTRERAEWAWRGDRRRDDGDSRRSGAVIGVVLLGDSDGGRAHTEISGPGVVFDDGALVLGKPG
jgi:hypothetical protein